MKSQKFFFITYFFYIIWTTFLKFTSITFLRSRLDYLCNSINRCILRSLLKLRKICNCAPCRKRLKSTEVDKECQCTRLLSTVHQLGVAPCILASLTAFVMVLCTLSRNGYVPLQWTTFQFSQASSQLSFTTKERHSFWLIAFLWTLAIFCMAS